jgi:iron-sulfur cluster repair protein YtfE (RIC family)
MTKVNMQENAIDLLKSDHREVESLFDLYDDTKAGDERHEIARRVCAALLIHMEIEEAIFYPAAREATGDDDILNEAESEHAGAKDIIVKLGNLQPNTAEFDGLIKKLKIEIEHHIDDEENELFPEVYASELNIESVGKRLAEMKKKILKTHGMLVEA